jgi:hypothetical protein
MAKGDKIVLFSKDSSATTAFYEILNANQTADSGTLIGELTNQAYLPVIIIHFSKVIILVD